MLQEDEFRIDSHKLFFHPHRVSHWLEGENIYPLYMEISPSGSCNHRCTICAKDYIGYPQRFLPTDLLMQRLTEFSSLGIRSIMYAGEGEPLLHPDIARIIRHTRTSGIDAALTTNGVLLGRKSSEDILQDLSWVKVSINAGTAPTYAKIHRSGPDDFGKVLANLDRAARTIDNGKLPCTLGAQAILLPENSGEMELLAKRVRDAGVSYLVIKPYSQHHKSHTRTYEDMDYSSWGDLHEKLLHLNDSSFKVIFRVNAIGKTANHHNRGYGRCLALPFWSYMDSAGNVWGCNAYIGDDRFCYGNILDNTFAAIWAGARRLQSLGYVADELDTGQCRMNCRMDEINRYLWELSHPSKHVNFI